MFVFIIKVLLGLLLIVWAIMMFVEIFKKNPVTKENQILYIKEHRETFGISDADVSDDFANKNIIVLTPEQLGLNSTGGGTY